MTHGSYFTFEAYAFPASTLGVRPRLPRGPWLSGTRIEYPIDEPLSFELDADYPGEVLPYYASAAPLMRGDLVDAIRAVEGAQLQTFEARLRDPFADVVRSDFKAVNVIGKSRSRADTELRIFVAEPELVIVLHQSVKEAIEARGITNLVFQAF